MATPNASAHEWIKFQRVYDHDLDHNMPNEVEARWCAMCGTLDLGETEEPARFFTTSGPRTSEPPCSRSRDEDPLQSIADSLGYFVDACEKTLGIPVSLLQSDGEEALRVRTAEGDIDPKE